MDGARVRVRNATRAGFRDAFASVSPGRSWQNRAGGVRPIFDAVKALARRAGLRFRTQVFSMDRVRRCDLALFLSLFEAAEAEQAGVPVALTKDNRWIAGSERPLGFAQKANCIRAVLGDRCIGAPPRHHTETWRPETLAAQLARVVEAPSILIRPTFELAGAAWKNTLARLGASEEAISRCPPFDPSSPDMLLIEAGKETRVRLASNGEIAPLDANDSRLALSLVDSLSFSGVNDVTGFEAAAVLDAVLLANWLTEEGLDDRFFVSHHVLLWFDQFGYDKWCQDAAARSDLTEPARFVASLRHELNNVYLRPSLDAVRQFFVERLPDVVRTGSMDWTALEWRLNSRCHGCGWLGADRWMIDSDRRRVVTRPDHYCSTRPSRAF